MKFWYEGFSVGGIVSSGEFEAENREAAASYLRSKGLYPQQIREVGVEEIKPVLPQEKKTFEDELGFIDQKPLREKKLSASEEFQKETDDQIIQRVAKDIRVAKEIIEVNEVKEKIQEVVDRDKCSSCCVGQCQGEPMEETQEVLKEAGQVERDMTALAEGANEMIDCILKKIGAESSDNETRSIVAVRVQESANRLMDKILWNHVERSRGPHNH
jgi:type II secretory pathway component PulF